jgi:hypothetical protein
VPISCRHRQDVGQGHQQCSRALGGIEQSGVGGGIGWPKGIATGCRKEAIDFSPGKEHQAGEKYEKHRILPEAVEREDADGFHREGNEHGVFTADEIRDPAEKRSREAVQDAIKREREGQGR